MVERQEQHSIRVLMNDCPHRPVMVLAQRIAQLAGVLFGFRAHRDRLHAHRAKGVMGIDQAQVVRRNPQSKQVFGVFAPAPLVLGQRNEALQVRERSHAVPQLPAPVAPLGIAGVRKQLCAAAPHGAAQDALRAAAGQAIPALRE